MTFDWNAVWDRKALSEDDALDISGFEHYRGTDTLPWAQNLVKIMQIEPEHTVLEIGCAAGLLGRHLKHLCHYIGTDRSEPMVKKTIALNQFSALRCDANDLPFKDKSIDHVFSFGVFHYFPDQEYAQKTISEMLRVARISICVSDLPKESHDPNHLLFNESDFAGWQISGSLYPREHERFTAFRRA
jgi:ubiquinone/menaquinone biosynthesis C-methylase UbiE